MAKVGRPTKYKQKLADEICHQLALGKSMRTVCGIQGMPDMATVFRWIRINKEFRNQYVCAKEEAADAMGEDVLDIADDGTNDWITRKFGKEEIQVVNSEAVQRSRLRVDTRKWLMSKMKPRKYGEKLDLTSDGKALPAPIYGGKSIGGKKV